MQLSVATAAVAQAGVSAEKPSVAVTASRSYVTLGSFSWDQDNDKIKVWCFVLSSRASFLKSSRQRYNVLDNTKLYEESLKNKASNRYISNLT